MQTQPLRTDLTVHGTGIDWDFFVELACRNHVALTVYRNRGHELLRGMPAQAAEALRQQYLGMVQHGLRLATTWREVGTALEAARVRVLPYKGRALASELYGDAAARHTWDIDLLLESADAARQASDLLRSRGYRIKLPPSGASLEMTLQDDCELTLLHEESGAAVELHWRLLPRAFGEAGSAEFMWAGATPRETEGVPSWAANPSATLRMLLLHGGVKHDWSELRLVADVARSLEHHTHDEVNAILRSIPRGTLREKCAAGLVLANRLLGAPAPPFPRAPHAQAALAMGRLFGRAARLPTLADWRHYVSCLRGRDGTTEPSLICYAAALTTPEFDDLLASRRVPRIRRAIRLVLKATRLRLQRNLQAADLE